MIKLTQQKYFIARCYSEENKETLLPMSPKEHAAQLAEATGFPVSVDSIRGLRKDMEWIPLPPPEPPSEISILATRIDALEARVAQLELPLTNAMTPILDDELSLSLE